jgi:hypothetical protein
MASLKKKNRVGKSPLNDNDEDEGIAGSDGGRGDSQSSIQVGDGGHGAHNKGGASFFGDSSGHNKDTFVAPKVRPHTKSTL